MSLGTPPASFHRFFVLAHLLLLSPPPPTTTTIATSCFLLLATSNNHGITIAGDNKNPLLGTGPRSKTNRYSKFLPQQDKVTMAPLSSAGDVLDSNNSSSNNNNNNDSKNPTPSPVPWDEVSEEYERRVEPFTSLFAEELLRPLLPTVAAVMVQDDDTDPSLPLRLLDVGCGTGAVSLLGISHGMNVVATDGSEAMVERTKERVRAELQLLKGAAVRGKDSESSRSLSAALRFLETSASAPGTDLPEDWTESVDLAVANFSVVFFPDPGEGLREMHRCLRPGGVAAISAWGAPSETPAFGVFRDVASELLPGDLAAAGKPKRIDGSIDGLTRAMEAAGFVSVRVVGPVTKTLRLESPSAYFDRFAKTSPPTVAVLRSLDEPTRSAFRRRVEEVAEERGGRGRADGSVALDASAYLAYGTKTE
eukprot:jgi/Psemu1/19381/gm1.19381_g